MDDVHDEITVTYPYSSADHAAALNELPLMRFYQRIQIGGASLMALAAAAAVVVGVVVADYSVEKALIPWIPVFLLSGFFVVTSRFLLPALESYRFRKATPNGSLQTRRFNTHGFAISADSPLIPWGLISQVRETEEVFLIADASSTTWTSMTKRALSDSDLQKFRSVLETNFRSRLKQLILLPPDSRRKLLQR